MEVQTTIDITALRKMFSRVDPALPLEKKIVEYYTLSQSLENNTFNKFMQYVLNLKFSTTDQVYKYKSLSVFYSTSKFINAFMSFYDMLTVFISRKIDPYFSNIEYLSTVKDDDEAYLVEFKITYYKE